MAAKISEPHTVVVKRPLISRDAQTNIATMDFENPSSTTSVLCFFQHRGGALKQSADGRQYSADGVIYTTSPNFSLDDRVEVSQSGLAMKFRVMDISPKYDIAGVLGHYRINVTREIA